MWSRTAYSQTVRLIVGRLLTRGHHDALRLAVVVEAARRSLQILILLAMDVVDTYDVVGNVVVVVVVVVHDASRMREVSVEIGDHVAVVVVVVVDIAHDRLRSVVVLFNVLHFSGLERSQVNGSARRNGRRLVARVVDWRQIGEDLFDFGIPAIGVNLIAGAFARN